MFVHSGNKSQRNERLRNAVSRLALILVALFCLYTGYHCLRVGFAYSYDASPPPTDEGQDITLLPIMLGAVLMGVGLIAASGAVLPWTFFERFAKPPSGPHQRIAQPRDYFK